MKDLIRDLKEFWLALNCIGFGICIGLAVASFIQSNFIIATAQILIAVYFVLIQLYVNKKILKETVETSEDFENENTSTF